MATKTFEELRKLAIQIRDEKANKQNTALRIGNFLLSSLDKMESMDIADIAEAVLQAETAADEAKRQADIVAQSGDIVEEAIKQGAAAEAAAAAANAAADKATNEGLFKTQQDLSEEEQGQVKRNLGIEDLMASLETQTIEGFSETVNATTSTKSVDNIIPPSIDFAIVDLGSTDGRELPTTPSMSVVLAKVTDDGRVKMQGYLKTSHEEYNLQVVSGSAEKYALNVNIITDTETTYKVFQIRYLSSSDGGKFKGSYGELSQLQAAYPTAGNGSYAFVGNPRHLYEWVTNAWTDRGEFITNVDQAIDAQSERAIANKAVAAKLTELERQKVSSNNSSETKVKDYSDGFLFCDKDGNIIAKITDNGIQAISFLDKEGNHIGKVTKEEIETLIGGESVNKQQAQIIAKDRVREVGVVNSKFDGFYFTDSQGNVMAKITKRGLQAINLVDFYGDIAKDGFYFCDKDNNVIAKITGSGFQAIRFIDKEGNEIGTSKVIGGDGVIPMIENNNLVPSPRKVHPLFGKDIYSFGNSLCKGSWEQMLANITGAKFNKEANNLTSWGGTFSGDTGGPLYNEEGYGKNGDMPGGLRRAKNFVLMPKGTYGNKDVIFFENVHDAVSEEEDISDAVPFMWTRYAVYESREFSGSNAQGEANSFFNDNRTSILSEVGFTEPKVGSMVKLKIKSITIPIIFTNGAASSGSVKITINGTDFETEVSEGDSIEQVIDKISVWSFSDSTGWKNIKKDATTINLQYIGGNSSTEDDIIAFDGQGTGVEATIQEKTESISYRTHAFMSLDVADWDTPSAWRFYGNWTNMFSVWKGIVEYIQKNCPETQMYMCLFPNSVYKKSYVRPDGSFDVEAFYNSSQWKDHLKNRRCLTEVAEYYNIPIIDLEKEMNVMCNWETYFPENNVHMKNALYQRFAEIIASKIY